MCTWDALVDVAKPGDRVEITGIYRATPIRTNPRRRTVRSSTVNAIDAVRNGCDPTAVFHDAYARSLGPIDLQDVR